MTLARLTFGLLAVAVVTGLALVPFYSPSRPLESLEALHGGIPWGSFLRSLHALSSWGLLVATALHLGDVVIRRAESKLPPGIWWRSVALLPLCVLALLGGFVLRADAEAAAALTVFREIAASVPLAGPSLAAFLLGTSPEDLGAVALHHAGTLTLLLWLLSSEHAGRLLPDVRATSLAALGTLAAAGLFPVPLGPPPGTLATGGLLLGPWYLLGLQGALLALPVAAGWLLPTLLVVLLGLFRHVDAPVPRRALLVAVVLWLVAYVAGTVAVLLR